MILYKYSSSQTTLRIMIRGESDGTVNVSVNGTTYPVTIDTAVMDGITKVDITGLTAGRTYPFTITDVDSTSYTGSFRTQPATGFNAVVFSCDNQQETPSQYKLAAQGLDYVVSVGDSPYLNSSGNGVGWGGLDSLLGSSDSPAASANTANYIAHHVRYWQKESYNELVKTTPYLYMGDDHEHANNDWVGDVTGQTELQLLTFNNSFREGGEFTVDPTSTGITEMAAAEAAVQESFDAIMQHNPDNTASVIDTNARYHNQYINQHVELFVLDCKSHCNAPRAPDTGDRADKFLIADNQVQWFLDALEASSSTFKLICSPKRTYDSSENNGDGWISYQDELDYILAQIDARGVTGVAWLGGDRHNFGVFASYAGVDGATYDHVCVSAGDINQSNHPIGTWHAYQIFGWGGEDQPAGAVPRRVSGYNLVHIPEDGTYCELSMLENTGDVLFTGRVYAGSNALTESKVYNLQAT